MKTALITGITGQDGAYLAEFLLKKGYLVHGIKRRSSLFNTDRIDHIYQDPHTDHQNFILHYGDLTDSTNLIRIIQEIKPDEIYNLGAQSHVHVSFETPEYTANSDALGALRILEAIRLLKMEKKTRFYQASTSELYGKAREIPQTEKTPFYPRSPYAVAKQYAFWIAVNYREAYGIFASNGILFNHESPIRGETFVTRKITRALARIALGLQDKFYLGNLSARRDFGHAKDYVEAKYLIMQHPVADDFVIATGITTEIRDFVRKSALELDIQIEFKGKGQKEKGIIKKINSNMVDGIDVNRHIKPGDVILEVDPRYYRPTEVDILQGDASKAIKELGWKPKYDIDALIKDMVYNDLHLMTKQRYLRDGGYTIKNYFE